MLRYDNCKHCANSNCEHFGKDREFIIPTGRETCKTTQKPATVALCVMWYGRNSDGSANYDENHHGKFYGTNCADVMHQYRAFSNNHDLSKYTHTEITGVYDL